MIKYTKRYSIMQCGYIFEAKNDLRFSRIKIIKSNDCKMSMHIQIPTLFAFSVFGLCFTVTHFSIFAHFVGPRHICRCVVFQLYLLLFPISC